MPSEFGPKDSDLVNNHATEGTFKDPAEIKRLTTPDTTPGTSGDHALEGTSAADTGQQPSSPTPQQ
jgi:hypothetical protein